MYKSFIKTVLLKPIVITSLILAILGLAGFLFSGQSALAQEDETLFLPLIMDNAFSRPPESIMILSPASGSTVTSPVRISGIAGPTFEQNLVLRVLLADGTELVESFTTIQAELGERGPYETELDIDLDSRENIFIQIYDTSARDGGIIHLSSIGVMFDPDGPEDIITRDPYPEQIVIFEPQMNETVTGGMVSVSGFAIAGFEQALQVEVLDEMGDVIAIEPVTVEAPDLGIPGIFQVDVEYDLTEAGPGRIVVRDISPAHGDDAHRSSVEVNLEP
jgi:hypothetical protein